MGLFGALFAGVSALRAQGVSLATISDNIANVSTIGYKGTTARFSSFVAEQASRFSYSSGGVRPVPVSLIDRQGELEGSASSTDLAISGEGFFVVSTSNVAGQGEFRYTRSGSFTVDKDGHLVNTSGHYLMGWPTDNEGDPVVLDTTTTAQLQLININNLSNAAVATTEFSLGANLPEDTPVGDSYTAAATVFDGFGTPHGVPLTFTRQPAYTDDLNRLRENVWNVSARAPGGATTIELKDNEGNTFAASGRLDFNKIPDEGETLMIGDLTFEFDGGDGVGEGNIGIPLSEINSIPDAQTALVDAYHTAFGGFEGPVEVALASELDSLGGRFADVPVVNPIGAGTISEAAFNILQGAFDEDTDNFTLDLQTFADGEIRLLGKTNIAIGINNERITDDSFGRNSADLSTALPGDDIRIYVRSPGPGGAIETEVFQLEVGANGIEAGVEGETTVGAISLDGFQYQSGGYPVASLVSGVTPSTSSFNPTTTTTVQTINVTPAADAALRAVAGFNADTLSLNLESSGAAAGAAATDVDLEAIPNISYQVVTAAGVNVGGNTSLNFGANSINLAPLAAGHVVRVFVDDGTGAAVRVANIELNGEVLEGATNNVNSGAIVIGGFAYDGAAGYTGPDTTAFGSAGTPGGSFGAAALAVASVTADVPESVRASLVQTGRLTGAPPTFLGLDLERVGAEIRLAGLTNISYRLLNPAGAVIGGSINGYGAASPNLTGLVANSAIELYVDSNGTAPRGDPTRVATLTLANPITNVGSVDGGITQNAIVISGFDRYTPGGLTAVAVPPLVAGVSPSPGGDFPDGTVATLPEGNVARAAQGRLNSLGLDHFNDVTRTLNLQLETIADPTGGVDRQTRIKGVQNLAFVFNSGGTNPRVPGRGEFSGEFGQPSRDLTQGVVAGDTIDVYVDAGGAIPSRIAQITLPGPLNDAGTVAGEETSNALQIGGFVYETDERLQAGTDSDNNTVFFQQNVEGGTVNFDASEIRSITQDRTFRVPAIVATDPPNVIFTQRGIPDSFNLTTADIQWSNGAGTSTIDINLGTPGDPGGLTQFAGNFTVNYVRQDGVPAGSISGINVGEGGSLIANFNNGRNQTIYSVPVATFPNTNALATDSGNVFNPTSDSGEALLRIPGVGATGRIAQNSLETSTVDIADEFSKMIITQRAFSAASRVVTTSDEMLDELVRIKR